MTDRRRLAAWLAGDGLALLVAVPLVAMVCMPGWFVGHDDLHPIRLFEQNVMIRAGQFPVRWYPDVSGGLGSPHPEFYAPLFYLVAQIFLFLGLSLTGALKGALACVLLGTSIATYRLGREFFGWSGGLVAAAAVTYAPYHLVDLFVRTAFSELTVFLFLPLTLLTLWKLLDVPSAGRMAAAALALTGLLLSHTVSLLIAPPVVAAFVALAAWRARSRSAVAAAAAAALIALANAAFFLAPLVVEKGAVQTEGYAAGYFDFHAHFASARDLIWSPWGFGPEGLGDAAPLSFRLGLLAWAGAAVAMLRWRRVPEAGGARLVASFAAAITAIGILMATSVSLPAWEWVAPLRFIQFPWRFLVLPTLGMALLCGAGVSTFGRGRVAIAAVLLFIACGAPMLGFERRLPLEAIRYRKQSSLAAGPDSSEAAPGHPRFTRAFVRDQLLYWADHLPEGAPARPPADTLTRPKVEVVSGSATLKRVEERPDDFRIEVEASSPSLLRLNVYRFPGWGWTLDGVSRPPGPAPADLPVLTMPVPEGRHVVEIAFRRTPARWAGDLLSCAGLLATAILGALALKRGPLPTPSP